MARGRGPLRVMYANHVGQISGAENSMVSLIHRLDRGRVAPVAAVPPGPLAEQLRGLGVEVDPVPELRLRRPSNVVGGARNTLWLRGWAGALRRAARFLGCDLVHANSLTAGIGACLAFRGRLPVVWHARDLRAPARAERWLLERVTGVVAISACVADHLFRVEPAARERTVLIYNGIDPQDFWPARTREEVRTELRIALDAPLVGTVGQLVPWKRQEVFLRAAAEIAMHVSRCRFLVVGADMFGEHREYVHKLRSLTDTLNIADRTLFTGYRDDAASVMASLDVLVHTAEHEPLGRAVLEAMSLGLPCVAADSCGPAELVQDGVSGLLVTPGDVDGFAREVINLLRTPATARRLGEAAKARVQERFSAQRTARLTEDMYEEVVTQALLS